jgi:hypothetical protein
VLKKNAKNAEHENATRLFAPSVREKSYHHLIIFTLHSEFDKTLKSTLLQLLLASNHAPNKVNNMMSSDLGYREQSPSDSNIEKNVIYGSIIADGG